MNLKLEQALELYGRAYEAEHEGNVTLAEVYYLESRTLFEQVGGTHYLNAADSLNALALLRQSHGDFDGALRFANQSICLMETHGAQFSSADAELIRSTAWEILQDLVQAAEPV